MLGYRDARRLSTYNSIRLKLIPSYRAFHILDLVKAFDEKVTDQKVMLKLTCSTCRARLARGSRPQNQVQCHQSLVIKGSVSPEGL